MTLKLRSLCAGEEGAKTKEMTLKPRGGGADAEGAKQYMSFQLRSGCDVVGRRKTRNDTQIAQRLRRRREAGTKDMTLKSRSGCTGEEGAEKKK